MFVRIGSRYLAAMSPVFFLAVTCSLCYSAGDAKEFIVISAYMYL